MLMAISKGCDLNLAPKFREHLRAALRNGVIVSTSNRFLTLGPDSVVAIGKVGV
jgi:hypothetical protein